MKLILRSVISKNLPQKFLLRCSTVGRELLHPYPLSHPPAEMNQFSNLFSVFQVLQAAGGK